MNPERALELGKEACFLKGDAGLGVATMAKKPKYVNQTKRGPTRYLSLPTAMVGLWHQPNETHIPLPER